MILTIALILTNSTTLCGLQIPLYSWSVVLSLFPSPKSEQLSFALYVNSSFTNLQILTKVLKQRGQLQLTTTVLIQ